MKTKLRTRIILITAAITLFVIGTNALITSYTFSTDYSETLQSKILVIGQTLKFQLERLLSLGIPVQNLVGFEKQCNDVTERFKEISYAMIVDTDGNILFQDDSSQNKKIADAKTLNAVRSEKETIQAYSENGKEYYDIIIPVFGADAEHIGAVRIGFPMEIVNQRISGMVLYSAAVSGVSFIFAILLLFFALSAWVTKPLAKLIDAIQEIRKSSAGLEKRVEIYSKDEIGELAQSFNSMIGEIMESRKELEKHQQELEKNVNERTSDLNEKMKEIEKSRTAILNMMEDSEETNKQLLKMQNELKNAMNELKKTDVKKDEFISVTAHEFKTPLTAIHGFAELLQEKKIDMKSTRKYLTIIKEETERLSKLVSEILNLSRIDLGTLKLTYEDIDLYGLVETIRSEADIKIKDRGLKSGYELEKRLPKIQSDREKLTEILLNLLDNAAKYTNKGSITMKIFREKDGVHFTVKDTGIGIPEEAKPKMFERFYQVDSSNTRKVGGTGLGLALSKEYVVTMGGKMWFVSEAGKGSEFHFTLPIKAHKKEEAIAGKEKYEGKSTLFKR